MQQTLIKLTDVVGDDLCVAFDDGEKVHDVIVSKIRQGIQVALSFDGVEDLTSAFLNAAVGQLYGEFPAEFLKAHLLPPVDTSSEDRALLKRVVERAKDFYADRERYEKAALEVVGNG